MTISKEVRIGVLVAASIVIFFAGFYFLKGSDVFSSDKEYYCYFNTASGLAEASTVEIKGLSVGKVTKMELAGAKGVKVTLSVHNDVTLPKGTVANLTSSGLLSGKVISLDLGSGPGEEAEGATLPSTKGADVMDQVSGELTPRLEELKETIASFNVTLARVNAMLNEENKEAIASTLRSLKTTSENLAHMSATFDKESAQITGIIRNANSITGSLAKSNDTIQRIISNTNRITSQLANAPLQKTIADLEKTAVELQAIMKKVNNGEGSLGLLVNDKELYKNLNGSLKSITNLTDDLKARPGRYINISVFGGKKKD
ncbi:MlaD family protein [Nemorincola caseinilytica]|uniref:MlaD family protein n=1 Tax=Nemorincola caseinilytica TaxID=2054315 RepID=A0ABP8NDE2_9BACT